MDDEKVKMRLLGISYTPMQQGAYPMILAEENGPMRLLIVIGHAEARSIAIKLENIHLALPITHDLFTNFSQAFGIVMTEAYIYKYEDGYFVSEIRFNDGDREITVDARASDAVALALRTNAPIYTTRKLLDSLGTTLEEADTTTGSEASADSNQAPSAEHMTVEQLKELMDRYISEENYEEAARINDIIKGKNNKDCNKQ